jgi:hypothetical protein
MGIRQDAAHVVMRRRRHRDHLARGINARRHAGGKHGGEVVRKIRTDRIAAIQKHLLP